jgi:hypothetical protein
MNINVLASTAFPILATPSSRVSALLSVGIVTPSIFFSKSFSALFSYFVVCNNEFSSEQIQRKRAAGTA